MNTPPIVRGLTVDAASARDLDDAFWVTRLSDGTYEMTVAIADVAKHVQIGSEIDQEAADRSFTRYIGAGEQVSMLPRRLAHEKISLNPGIERDVVYAKLLVSSHGAVQLRDLALGTMASSAKLSHHDFEREFISADSPFQDMLVSAISAAGLLYAARARSALSNARSSIFDANGMLTSCYAPGEMARAVVGEIMLAFNGAITKHMAHNHMPIMYRADSGGAGTLLGARWEAHPKSHNGLGLDRYAQFSSPLRRYPDLINQRVLRAALKQSPAPYMISQIIRLSVHANRQNAEMNTLKASVKAPVRAPAPLNPASALGMSEATGKLLERLHDGAISYADMTFYLLDPTSPVDEDCKRDLVAALLSWSDGLTRFWDYARAQGYSAGFRLTVRQLGTGWQAMLSKIGDAVVIGDGASPNEARIHALERFTAREFGWRMIPDPDPTVPEPNETAWFRLLDLCRSNGWEDPVLSNRFLADRMLHEAQVSVPLPGWDLETGPLVSARGPEARNMAAACALRLATQYLATTQLSPGNRRTLRLKDLSNLAQCQQPLAEINRLFSRDGKRPVFEWMVEDPDAKIYTVRITVVAQDRSLTMEGTGTRRLQAMERAAKSVLEVISSAAQEHQARVRLRA